jgi:glycosyltransferase XagB
MAHMVLKTPALDPADLIGVPRMSDSDLFHLEVAQRLIAQKKLKLTGLAKSLLHREKWGADLAQTIISSGQVRPVDYYRTVAQVLDLPFVDLNADPVDENLVRLEDRSDYAQLSLLPWRKSDGKTVIATTAVTPRHFEWAISRYEEDGFEFVITAPFDILWQSGKLFREWDSFLAREGLYSWKPEHSAKHTFSRSQLYWMAGIGITLLVALIAAPFQTLVAIMAAATTLYTATFLFKFVLTIVGSSRKVDMNISPEAVAAVRDDELPVYTVLVPMYREAKVLPLLVNALQKLDYPASKLEVKLVLEENDDETIEAAKALGAPGTFEIVRVPHSQPKTKPKACNYALQFSRGEFVTIYDAEDQPEPDQLKKAVLAFRHGDPQLACVQGRLNYFNRSENWLTRMFTLEYSQWFDFLLPGLDWMKVPIPLGGTSNHFKLSALRQVGAWDPYNVTEDADLGIRLAQEGYIVGVINSTTYEEANGVLPSWIKQRSRWIKGYMQTWLVHMRHPIQLWRSIGTKGFFAFHFFIGAPPFTMLFAPVVWGITVGAFVARGLDLSWLFPEPFGSMAFFNLVIGNLFLVYFGVVAALKRRYFDLVAVGVMLPVYWVLHSVASYKALWQLIRNPHYWEKTEHGTSAVTQRTLDQVAAGKAAAA